MNGVLDFLSICENLKTTKRTGWVDNGIKGPESISDHMHRMAIISMLTPSNAGLDVSRIIKIALVHDLAEAVCGDITPSQNIPKAEKHRIELDAITTMLMPLGNSDAAREIMVLWQEYEDAVTSEALFVKDIDKFEMILQAFEYEKRDSIRLDSFYESTKGKIKHPLIAGLRDALMIRRDAHFQSIKAMPPTAAL